MFYRDAAGRGVQAVSEPDARGFVRHVPRRDRARRPARSTRRRSTRSRTGLARVRDGGGRLFILGVGGSAGHASHAVNDFRKICGFEAYTPDRQRLRAHGARQRRGLGHQLLRVAQGLAPRRARRRAGLLRRRRQPREERLDEPGARDRARQGAWAPKIFGIVGKDGGAHEGRAPTRACSSRPCSPDRITPHTEGLCAVVWHLLVSPPGAQARGDQVGIDEVTQVRPHRRAALLHRRRRRLHRQPLHRSPARASAARRGRHALRQLLVGAGVALRAPRAATPRLRVVRGDVEDLRRAARRHGRATTW